MPSGIHQMEVDVPIQHVWTFVSDMNQWAPLVPGYSDHDILNDRKSIWKLQGDIAILPKTVSLSVDITEWLEPNKVTFQISGLKNTVQGDGYFQATELTEKTTQLTGCLSVNAKGMMGPLINNALKDLVAKKGRQLTESIGKKMMEQETVST